MSSSKDKIEIINIDAAHLESVVSPGLAVPSRVNADGILSPSTILCCKFS